jgi:hypothetical protein
VASGKRTIKSGGGPGAKWSRRGKDHRRVLTWLAGRWRNHQPKRAKKPHSIVLWSISRPLDGPATRPKTPFAWRIASGSWQPRRGGRAECQHGKESMANSHPQICLCSAARLGRDIFFGNGKDPRWERQHPCRSSFQKPNYAGKDAGAPRAERWRLIASCAFATLRHAPAAQKIYRP